MVDKYDINFPKYKYKVNLKIFLGYAPGVGKTFSMLNEANRRFQRGQDVVIGFLETHGRNATDNQILSLEEIPRKKYTYNSTVYEELDLQAVLDRHPQVILIDELAHTNAPNSKNKKRYEDVIEILSKGISVITTLNIEHLESLNDVIKQITGITVKDTIPDRILDLASEIVVVDITPSALLSRLKRGDIFSFSETDNTLKNFYRLGNLNALREISLRQAAEGVEGALEDYMKEHGIKENWHTVERVMVCISANPYAKKLIRRGARIAKRNKCALIVVDVKCTHFLAPKASKKDIENLENHFKLAKQLGAEVVTLEGKSISKSLAEYAETRHITQIIIGHSNRTKLQTIFRGSTIAKLLRLSKDIEIHVIPTD